MGTTDFNINLNITSMMQNHHDLLSERSPLSKKIQQAVLRQLDQLEKAFQEVKHDLAHLPVQVQENADIQLFMKKGDPHPLLAIKRDVAFHLLKQDDVGKLMALTSRIEKRLKEVHRNGTSLPQKEGERKFAPLPSDQSLEMARKIILGLHRLKAEDLISEESPLKMTEEKLGSNMAHKALQWLQASRVKLLKGEGKTKLAPHQLISLMKKIGDLEDRLQQGERQSFIDFKELLFTQELDLSEVYLASTDEESGASLSFFVYDVAKDDDRETKQRAGVFKPMSGDAGVKPAVPKGSSLARQAAAFMIDKMNGGKAGVAFTLLAKSEEHGVGALQVFKETKGSLFDFIENDCIHLIPTDLLHILTLHRLRLYDLDGHPGNVLWNLNDEGKINLISIDHDYCFPVFDREELMDDINNSLKIQWHSFPQLDQPFSESTREYIRSIDVKKEVEALREFGLELESINLFKVMTWVIQRAEKSQILLPGEITEYLFQQTRGRGNFPLIRQMIQVQNELTEYYPNPTAADKETYEAEFENKMQQYIDEKLTEQEEDIKLNGSWRRK